MTRRGYVLLALHKTEVSVWLTPSLGHHEDALVTEAIVVGDIAKKLLTKTVISRRAVDINHLEFTRQFEYPEVIIKLTLAAQVGL